MPGNRASVETTTRDLLALLHAVWERLTATEAALHADWLVLGRAERLRRLQALIATVEQLMDSADEAALRFVYGDLPTAWTTGAAEILGTATAVTGVDYDALAQLVNDTYTDLLQATTYVRTSTKQLVRRLTREAMAGKFATGQHTIDAGKQLAEIFAGHGIAAVVYKDGSRHGLQEYASMLARTKSAIAYQTGGQGAMQAAGIGYVEILDNPRCGLRSHDDPEKPNGRVYPLEVVAEHPISHPNCVRSSIARPDIVSADQADAAAPTVTVAQNADQAQVAAGREAAAASPQRRRTVARRQAVLEARARRAAS